MGKILLVDLTHLKTAAISTEPYADRFLGGRGIATRLYWETVSPETGAYDPDNRLIFMTGPLIATGAQGATRMSVVGMRSRPSYRLVSASPGQSVMTWFQRLSGG